MGARPVAAKVRRQLRLGPRERLRDLLPVGLRVLHAIPLGFLTGLERGPFGGGHESGRIGLGLIIRRVAEVVSSNQTCAAFIPMYYSGWSCCGKSGRDEGRRVICRIASRCSRLISIPTWCRGNPEDEAQPNPKTVFLEDASESIIVKNGQSRHRLRRVDQSLSRLRAWLRLLLCAAHARKYLGFSAGLDFETKIMVKKRAPELLRRELASPKWRPQPLAMSGVTDCYQPAERHFPHHARLPGGAGGISPAGLDHHEEFFGHARPGRAAAAGRVRCGPCFYFHHHALNADLAARLEPRASRPAHRLRAIEMAGPGGRAGRRPGGADHSRDSTTGKFPPCLRGRAGAAGRDERGLQPCCGCPTA